MLRTLQTRGAPGLSVLIFSPSTFSFLHLLQPPTPLPTPQTLPTSSQTALALTTSFPILYIQTTSSSALGPLVLISLGHNSISQRQQIHESTTHFPTVHQPSPLSSPVLCNLSSNLFNHSLISIYLATYSSIYLSRKNAKLCGTQLSMVLCLHIINGSF